MSKVSQLMRKSTHRVARIVYLKDKLVILSKQTLPTTPAPSLGTTLAAAINR